MFLNIYDFLKASIIISNKDNIIYTIILVTILELLSKLWNGTFNEFKNYSRLLYKSKVKPIETVNNMKYEIMYVRNFKERYDQRADAILNYVTKVKETSHIIIDNPIEYIDTKECVPMDKCSEIWYETIEILKKENGLDTIRFKLASNTKTIPEIEHYVDEIVEEYIIQTKNKLGKGLYFFDQSIEKRTIHPNDVLRFSLHKFNSNRHLNNVYMYQQDEFRTRINLFKNNKEWYDKRGIPYTFGALLYGEPGTGKTSTIKAVANELDRHVFNISLSRIEKVNEFKALFYDERVKVDNTSIEIEHNELRIPIDKRLYIIEDIDDLDQKFVSRESDNKLIGDTLESAIGSREENVNKPKTELTLSIILNILDGVLETPGRVIFITTNYPERLDKALIRPGRMDMLVEFTRTSHKMLKDMIENFYEIKIEKSDVQLIKEYKWTPAEVFQIMFKNIDDYRHSIIELQNNQPKTFETNTNLNIFPDSLNEMEFQNSQPKSVDTSSDSLNEMEFQNSQPKSVDTSSDSLNEMEEEKLDHSKIKNPCNIERLRIKTIEERNKQKKKQNSINQEKGNALSIYDQNLLLNKTTIDPNDNVPNIYEQPMLLNKTTISHNDNVPNIYEQSMLLNDDSTDLYEPIKSDLSGVNMDSNDTVSNIDNVLRIYDQNLLLNKTTIDHNDNVSNIYEQDMLLNKTTIGHNDNVPNIYEQDMMLCKT